MTMNASVGRLIRYSSGVGRDLSRRTSYSLGHSHRSSTIAASFTDASVSTDFSSTRMGLPPPWSIGAVPSSWGGTGAVQGKRRVSLVIFDKDGTLICFNAMWIPWVRAVARRLSAASGRNLSGDVYRLLGYCPVEERVRSGLLAEATMAQIEQRLVQMLSEAAIMPEGRAKTLVDEAVRQCASVAANDVREIHDTRRLFKQLRQWGVRVAICTADNRASTSSTLRALQLDSHVDHIVCGDDENSLPKPHPHNALTICRALGVPIEEAVVVGDTLADLRMGRSAQLGMSVGVLSGVATARELQPHADHLLEDVGQLCTLVKAINIGASEEAYGGSEQETRRKISNYI